jgi:hypothetical protein
MTVKLVKPVSADAKAKAFIEAADHPQAPIVPPPAAPEPKPEAPEPAAKVMVNMRLDPELLQRVNAAAKRLSITRTGFVSMALAEKLEKLAE